MYNVYNEMLAVYYFPFSYEFKALDHSWTVYYIMFYWSQRNSTPDGYFCACVSFKANNVEDSFIQKRNCVQPFLQTNKQEILL